MITVTKKDKEGNVVESKTFDNRMLSAICLAAGGGGLTEAQTIVAMMLQDNLINHGYVKCHFGRVIITMDDDGEAARVLNNIKEKANG